MLKSRIGNKNPFWKGDGVGYMGAHGWLKRHNPNPNKCELCGKKTRCELANKSGSYSRKMSDYRWLCPRCHRYEDGIIAKLQICNLKRKNTSRYRICKFCGEKHWVIKSVWLGGHGRYCSKPCSNRGRLMEVI